MIFEYNVKIVSISAVARRIRCHGLQEGSLSQLFVKSQERRKTNDRDFPAGRSVPKPQEAARLYEGSISDGQISLAASLTRMPLLSETAGVKKRWAQRERLLGAEDSQCLLY
ncbi:hypothetical protein MRX96_044697 [Rhipicephalus microplus]